MSTLAPRVVLVTRRTEYESLLAAHGTRGQAEFFLRSRRQSLEALEARFRDQMTAVDLAKRALPADWSLAQVLRDDLDRFLFTPNDIVVAVGQDGLVANLAKYASGQPIIGIAPAPTQSEGVLTELSVDALPQLLLQVASQCARVERRAMVEARIGEGQTLAALNDLFIGHRSHQSARYSLRFRGSEEVQSSSGVIVSTGTGLTGWARSILAATHRQAVFSPEDKKAVYFAREPWPSRTTGCALSFGLIEQGHEFSIRSHIEAGGVVFADGIEQDFLRFDYGTEVTIGLSERTLNLVRN